MRSKGRIDFYIPDFRWAIEVLRDGVNIKEHIAHFLPAGRYYEALKARRVKSVIMLDFRQSVPSVARHE
jgi:hypothetical protein